MNRTKKVWLTVTGFFILYLSSYCCITTQGYYYPMVRGFVQGSGEPGHGFLAAKKNGYLWFSMGDYEYTHDGQRRTLISLFFAPLESIDHRYWHTREKVYSMDYPIRNYFDAEKHVHFDHVPE